MEEKEFTEGKILITEILEYDAIFFKDQSYEEKVCKFITNHGGLIEQRDIKFDSSSPRILNEIIKFKYYGFSDYADYYKVGIGNWILVPKNCDGEKFIITSDLPKCIKVKGEIC